MITDINNEDRLVQQTFAAHLQAAHGWESVYAHTVETFGPTSLLGRASDQDVVLVRDLRAAMALLNPDVPAAAREQAIVALTRIDVARSLIQHNREYYGFIRDGVPVTWQDAAGVTRHERVHVIDYRAPHNNRFLAVRELRVQGRRVPHYNRRIDLACFVNGLPLVVFELKAVYRNIRAGFDGNLSDYLDEHTIAHAFHHNVFLVVSNGDAARYGSITSKWDHFVEWKRNWEQGKARLDAEALLDGMLAKERLLDLVENFILFDDSRAGGTRKIVARNHQVLGVNNAVDSVRWQVLLRRQYHQGARWDAYGKPLTDLQRVAESSPADTAYGELLGPADGQSDIAEPADDLPSLSRAHPAFGRLGVFWHTQGSGKSYSMAFFSEKVRRVVPGNFTFMVMTDRTDLDDQIWRTFIGCGLTDDQTPRAGSGKDLQTILQGNPRYVFSLIHKFNQPVTAPYSSRDDIIVLSDEAHRTQAGKFARNMRLALPNAAFIGFTGTPLFKHDQLTRRIFGDYISRYDFRRSEEDGSTVRLVYENRGEKLGLARMDLNDRIAEAIEQSELDPDQTALLERLLGRDYEIITADDRLAAIAADFVDHRSAHWDSGKAMLVCIDKITCGRMSNLIAPLWQAKLAEVRSRLAAKEAELAIVADHGGGSAEDFDARERLTDDIYTLRSHADWMDSTIIEIVISEAQNEVRDFQRWSVDIVPHRTVMKTGFETPDGKRMSVEDAFKDPEHPFRIAIVCAMWLTGFDVECLSTLYIDKPMRAHNLMQAIARANRVYPGKDCGVIVDYNGMLRSLREALAIFAIGDDSGDDDGDSDIVTLIADHVAALRQAIEEAEAHLRTLGFDPARIVGAHGFDRIECLRDAVDALYTTDEAKRRFEIMARQVFSRFKTLINEPSAIPLYERHDNIEAIYKKLQDRRDTADVTALLKELQRIVNEAVRTAASDGDHTEALTVDLSHIDFERLRDEFASKVHRKHAALQDIRTVVEQKLAQMLARNPMRMDYYKQYQQIIADYNREKDRVTVEDTFARLVAFAAALDEEQRRTIEENLTDDELALFDMLRKEDITQVDRERVKQASRSLLASVEDLVRGMSDWTHKAATQAEVEIFILDRLYSELPRPPFTEGETVEVARRVYAFVWEKSVAGWGGRAA